MTVCSRPEDGLRCQQRVKPPFKLKIKIIMRKVSHRYVGCCCVMDILHEEQNILIRVVTTKRANNQGENVHIFKFYYTNCVNLGVRGQLRDFSNSVNLILFFPDSSFNIMGLHVYTPGGAKGATIAI